MIESEESTRGEEQHECDRLKSLNSKDSKALYTRVEHENLYAPELGVEIFKEDGEWVMAIADEFVVSVMGCPFCLAKLDFSDSYDE